MPPRTPRLEFPAQVVTAVVVSHDGARWLETCLAALREQIRPPQRIVAVDTGSVDGSHALLVAELGDDAVVSLPRGASLGAAVRAALAGPAAAPHGAGGGTEWLWLLHDDCAPDPDALREQLTAASDASSVTAWGAKVVSWDGHRLASLGLTVDSSGHLHTGIEPQEVDQGQHDDVGDVLATSTAGLLVRRDRWEAVGGLDEAWPLYADDVDLGWRLNAHGDRVRVAPRARVRHAAALHTGQRRADALAGRSGAAERRHGMQVVLANTSPALVPLLAVRYVVESLLRALVLLLGRRPTEAVDELAAVGGLVARPGVVLAARRRRRSRSVPHRDLRALMAPAGLRWRALVEATREAVGRDRTGGTAPRQRLPIESGPVAEEAESFPVGTGAVTGVLRRPAVLLALGLTAVALVAARGVLGGTLHGGRLLPAPGGAADLWSTYLASWHPVGLGTTTTTPPAVAGLALLSSVLLGKAWLAVDLLVIGAVPLAGLTAYAAAGAVVRRPALRAWAAVVYALSPVLTGAVAGGRIDVIAGLVLLPLVVRAGAAALRAPRGQWWRWVGAGLLLGLATAFAPMLWPVAVAVVLLAVLVRPDRAATAPAGLVLLAVPAAVLLPWTVTAARHPSLLFAGGGLPETLAAHRPLGPAGLLLLHPGGPAQPPLWVLVPLLLAALVALARRRERGPARAGLVLLVAGLAVALLASRVGVLPGHPDVRGWAGPALAVALVGALTAALSATTGARTALRRHSFGWRQAAAGLLVVAVAAGTVAMAAAWLVRGAAGPLTDSDPSVLPVFAAAEVDTATSPRILVLRPAGGVLHYTVVRGSAGPRLGDGDVLARDGDAADAALTAAVRAVAAGQSSALPALARFGITMIVVPSADSAAVGRLADVDGLSRVPTGSAVVWRLGQPGGELVVDSGDPQTPVQPLQARAGHADVTVPSGPAGRLLVLAESARPGWTATLDGHRLMPTRAYGWAQAWRLPSTGGRLQVTPPTGGRPGWLVGELVAVALALLLSLPGRRRRVEPEPVVEPQLRIPVGVS